MKKDFDINGPNIGTADDEDTPWKVKFTGKARKQKEQLPPDMKAALLHLKKELEWEGPIQSEWANYGKLKGKKNIYHCHLTHSHDSCVVVWKVTDKKVQLMEIRYVGTHENANYRRIS